MSKTTIDIPDEDYKFAQDYAREHGMSLDELIHAYLKNLRQRRREPSHTAAVNEILGLIPDAADAHDEYITAMVRKHQ